MKLKLQNSKKIFKGAVYALLLLIFYVLQTDPFLFPSNFAPNLLLILAVCASMFETEIPAGVIGLCAGLLKDIGSPTVFGFYGLFYMLIAIGISFAAMYLLRQTMLNFVGVLATSYILMTLLYMFFYYLVFQNDGAGVFILSVFPLSFIFTLAVSPLIFLLIRKLNELL